MGPAMANGEEAVNASCARRISAVQCGRMRNKDIGFRRHSKFAIQTVGAGEERFHFDNGKNGRLTAGQPITTTKKMSFNSQDGFVFRNALLFRFNLDFQAFLDISAYRLHYYVIHSSVFVILVVC